MLQRAAREHQIDISSSWVVGDRHDIDMQLARNAGAHCAMVLTGYGQEAYDTERKDWSFEPEIIAANLLEAIRTIVSGTS
jgi:histidinol phosphatase-like enzyme